MHTVVHDWLFDGGMAFDELLFRSIPYTLQLANNNLKNISFFFANQLEKKYVFLANIWIYRSLLDLPTKYLFCKWLSRGFQYFSFQLIISIWYILIFICFVRCLYRIKYKRKNIFSLFKLTFFLANNNMIFCSFALFNPLMLVGNYSYQFFICCPRDAVSRTANVDRTVRY